MQASNSHTRTSNSKLAYKNNNNYENYKNYNSSNSDMEIKVEPFDDNKLNKRLHKIIRTNVYQSKHHNACVACLLGQKLNCVCGTIIAEYSTPQNNRIAALSRANLAANILES